jgi:hypothetical protein
MQEFRALLCLCHGSRKTGENNQTFQVPGKQEKIDPKAAWEVRNFSNSS